MEATDMVVPYRERCARRRAELESIIARLVDFALVTPDIAEIVVFGSFARGLVSPWSDLDALVIRDAGPHDLVDDVYRVCATGGDIIGIRTADFPYRLTSTPFGRAILSDGKQIYARPA